MNVLYDQSHYEVLEVPSNAAAEDIERAYQLVCATYRTESLALYSIFGTQDVAVIRDRIDEAYRVLSDPDSRSAYRTPKLREGPCARASWPLSGNYVKCASARRGR